MSNHEPECLKTTPSCICLTCTNDDRALYNETTELVTCCDQFKRWCDSEHICPGYQREEEQVVTSKMMKDWERQEEWRQEMLQDVYGEEKEPS